jgi:hypothetical protein
MRESRLPGCQCVSIYLEEQYNTDDATVQLLVYPDVIYDVILKLRIALTSFVGVKSSVLSRAMRS